MRKLIYISSIILLFGCQSEKQSNSDIEEQIIEITNAYHQVWETVNMDAVAKYHADDIRYYWHGFKAASSNDEFLKVFKEWMSSTAVWEMEVENYDVQVLTRDIAIIGYNTKSTTTILTNGESYDYGNGALSYVWKKINGDWKIIHIHESALDNKK
ncbi:nuclear transport factor 2 family protein [Flagellimonas oceanensis]|uniref:nuclear transport factor 2 family protein n=1 Tax=Flagellimonas oceanensis TaxID=2499163 RepID=UPI003BA8CC29